MNRQNVNQKEIVVTSGAKYIDIDVLACGVAYQKLLELNGVKCRLVLQGPVNESVSKSVRTWNFNYVQDLNESCNNFNVVLVDISDPTYCASFVMLGNVIEVYDHRVGFEGYWRDRIGDNAKIEMVGSCATLIWEEYIKQNFMDKIDSVSANLLYTAILSNTLNFKARVTTPRDIDAANELMLYTTLPKNWREMYFQEITKSVMHDPNNALTNDTKETTISGLAYRIGQIELWDGNEFVQNHRQVLLDQLAQSPISHCFITVASIAEGCNYLLCSDESTKSKLEKAIGAKFDGDLGKTTKLWLRKEIMRELQE